MSRNKRTDPKIRRRKLLTAALEVASKQGYQVMTFDQIAEEAQVSKSLVCKYFGTMPKLRRDVMRAAVRDEVLPVIAQGLINKDPHAKKASKELQEKAKNCL